MSDDQLPNFSQLAVLPIALVETTPKCVTIALEIAPRALTIAEATGIKAPDL